MTVAIIGPGMIGAAHAGAWRATGTEVSYLVSRRADAALDAAPNARTVTDVAFALDDPDVHIVSICTPTPTHRELAVAALRAGKHVLLEKPMALTVEDAEAIATVAEGSGLILMVAHVVRFFPEYERMRLRVDGGEVGHPLHVRAERMIAQPPTPWWYDEDQSGGLVVDVGIHDLDQANVLLGAPVTVRATASDPLGPVETTVRYAGGGLAQVLSHARMPESLPFATSLQVIGDGGLVAIRSADPLETDVPETASASHAGADAVEANPYARQAAHFMECVASGRPSTVAPVGDAVLALRTALAARDSLRAGGGWVSVG
ncbi:Gfo/Idh/MocA family oxidoreductase [Planctomonas sp. JC2975]|uniref:Gfo/Idh/MocA family protein n=1 Tax=Planctomonas sp. JC2975 TaxID=2729626 RepID=UPI001473414E|nr:Gfo/Idh/MocA family oxidoreductase [Planctomonas sp. JC2975]NNC12447.1 Gfo/Idh/MocA family oxidoreductase [Planctomonas sp. JC2975]